jgi:hypothetical protein
VLIVPAGCISPDEETWMQIVSIGETSEDAFVSTSVVKSELQSATTDAVDVVVQNTTVILGGSGGGVSITVYHATVEYFVEGQNLPSYEYVVILYLPAPTTDDVGEASSTGTLEEFPLVPAALKDWILDPANFPAEVAARGFTGEARITLRGRTEEDKQIETSAGITVVFN